MIEEHYSKQKSKKLVVGLGNPGERYAATRHNVGFMFVDHFSKKWDIPLDSEKKKTVFGKKFFEQYNAEIILLKPLTFSNLAMEAVLYIASFLKVDRQDIMVVYDDITAELGEHTLDGPIEDLQHNGVKNLIDFFMGDDFLRCGIGIGSPPRKMEHEKFYLSDLTIEEMRKLITAFGSAEDTLVDFFKKREDRSETVEHL